MTSSWTDCARSTSPGPRVPPRLATTQNLRWGLHCNARSQKPPTLQRTRSSSANSASPSCQPCSPVDEMAEPYVSGGSLPVVPSTNPSAPSGNPFDLRDDKVPTSARVLQIRFIRTTKARGQTPSRGFVRSASGAGQHARRGGAGAVAAGCGVAKPVGATPVEADGRLHLGACRRWHPDPPGEFTDQPAKAAPGADGKAGGHGGIALEIAVGDQQEPVAGLELAAGGCYTSGVTPRASG